MHKQMIRCRHLPAHGHKLLCRAWVDAHNAIDLLLGALRLHGNCKALKSRQAQCTGVRVSDGCMSECELVLAVMLTQSLSFPSSSISSLYKPSTSLFFLHVLPLRQPPHSAQSLARRQQHNHLHDLCCVFAHHVPTHTYLQGNILTCMI